MKKLVAPNMHPGNKSLVTNVTNGCNVLIAPNEHKPYGSDVRSYDSPVLKISGSPLCDHFNRTKFWCCLDHYPCFTGRPSYYKGMRLCAFGWEEHDKVVFPSRIRRFWE